MPEYSLNYKLQPQTLKTFFVILAVQGSVYSQLHHSKSSTCQLPCTQELNTKSHFSASGCKAVQRLHLFVCLFVCIGKQWH